LQEQLRGYNYCRIFEMKRKRMGSGVPLEVQTRSRDFLRKLLAN
jgi:hypothetical protein